MGYNLIGLVSKNDVIDDCHRCYHKEWCGDCQERRSVILVESKKTDKIKRVVRFGLCERCMRNHDIDTNLLDQSLSELGLVAI
ncbi:hypothetical protein EKI60_06375 [Candidatus Saccharibacteria bacterium]|nr:MAG: hypothetical protein EKI60_06375 [Candidatus Saccharibacteria bacterium]